MVDFDKFEKNVKDNYGNQQFPFDEANWEKAAKLIDASRKGKNRGGIFFLSAVAILCTSGLVYYFGFSDSSNALKGKDIAINQVVTEQQTINSGNSSPASTENTPVSGNEENTKLSNGSSASNETTNDNSTITNSSVSKNKLKNNKPSSLNTSVNSAATKTADNNTSSHNETKSEEKTTSTPSTTNSETKANSTAANTKPKNNTNNTPAKSTPNKNTTPPVLGSNNSAQTPKTVIEPNVAGTGGNSEKSGTPSNENKTVVIKTNPVATDSSSNVVTATVKPTESVVDSVPPMRKSRADSLAAMMPKGDGVSYATNVKDKPNAKNILFLEAGTTYLLGWNGGGKNEAGGFNVLAGVNFQHFFTGAIGAQIGIQYNTISNLTNSTHTISTVKYDFGMEQDVTEIKYQKLHYLVAPVRLTYVHKDNTFSIGANVAYLLNSDSKKEKYKTYSSDPNANKKDLTSTKETGYVKGFNPYDVQLALGYKRKIYKGLSAGADVFYGLTDTKDNSFFKSNAFDRNVGVKVSLCYDLFKK